MSGTVNNVAVRAEDFVQSIGVNTHMNWQNAGSGWANPSVVEADISYLGIYNVRDAPPQYWDVYEYQALANTGVKFDLTVGGGTVDLSGDIANIVSLATISPGSVIRVEGPNEINLSPIYYNGVSSTSNLAVGTQVQQALYNMVHGNSALAGVQVVDLTLGEATAAQYASLGNIGAYADVGNFHTYFSNGVAPATKLAANVATEKSLTPGKPIVITETGYYTAPLVTDWGGVNQDVQAKQTLDDLLDAYKDGVSTTYIYELMDDVFNPSPYDLNSNFGLFFADGTPKEAATALHNLTTLLSDSASNAQGFTTGSMAYSLGNLPGTGNSLLMQKASGVFDLVVWNEPVLWNEATLSENSIASTNVTVNLGATYQSVSVYSPIDGTSPIATYSNVSSLVIALSDHPLVIEASVAGASTAATQTVAATTTTPTATATTTAAATPAVTATATASGTTTYNLTASGGAQATSTGWNDTVNLGAGPDSVTVLGNATINGGTGNATIAAAGSWVTATTGTGATLLYLNAGGGVVTTHGTDTIDGSRATSGLTVDAEGPSTRVTGGNTPLWYSGNTNATVSGGVSNNGFAPGTGAQIFTTAAGATDGFYLSSGSDTILAGGNDTVYGGTGAASVTQTGSAPLLVYGASGNMTLTAGSGNASLYGAGGAATVNGGSGNLLVQDGWGATTVNFGHGNSTIVGGYGPETYNFVAGSGGGTEVIQNFTTGTDYLHLSGFAGNAAAQAISGGHATSAGFTMTLSDGTTIVMSGLSSLQSSAFI